MNIQKESRYQSTYLPLKTPSENAWALVFVENKLIINKTETPNIIPKFNELIKVINVDETFIYLGQYDGNDCFCKRVNEMPLLPNNLILIEPREITALSGDSEIFLLAGTANHLLHWNKLNQYCGNCGHKTIDKKEERAKVCPNCGNTIYPRISPATITAVMKGNQILLAHNSNFKKGVYSLIAGFVEPGETLEQCVAREIYEEVGIQVKNIRYYTSQPWPFPDSLMLAFTAEYDSGEIKVDENEITDAAWFHADHLPDIPSTDSVAGKMIRFLSN